MERTIWIIRKTSFRIPAFFVTIAKNKLIGDLNEDRVVNIVDIALVAKSFRTKPRDQNWNATANLDKNGEVNM